MNSTWTKQGMIQFLTIESHTCMEKAFVFHRQGLHKQSLTSVDQAIRCIFTACYMKENETTLLKTHISDDELFSTIRSHYHLDLNGDLLLSTACFLAEHYDLMIDQHQPSKEQIKNMLMKITLLLEHIIRQLLSA
ncbi:MAG: hypothetical protein H7X86_06755 [Gorillibacterium sp.]|nr:hypothetical protein [Gorillibacterium sp.]